MANEFKMDDRELKKLKKFLKKAPELFKPASANVLNTLAFKTRQNDIKNIKRHMTIRNERFLKSAIRVDKARNSAPVDKQISFVYSIKKPRFSGWKEQQKGTQPKLRRTFTTHARRGARKNRVSPKFKLRSKNKFYKPEQYKGKTLQQRFYFMMRVLASRGGGVFLLSNKIPTKAGHMGRGLYQLKKGRIVKLQDFEKSMHVAKFAWRTLSLQQLQSETNLFDVWIKSIRFIIKRKSGLKR